MKASIIMPTYNRANVLSKSLDTCFAQTLPLNEYEVILVDNNSLDNTLDIAEIYQKKYSNFRYIKELKAGATHARHTGAKNAQSDILVFVDDDGLFNPSLLEEILKVYETNSSVVAVTGKIDLLWDAPKPDWIEPYEFMLAKLDYGNEIKFGYDLYLNGLLFSINKNIFENLKGFNPDYIGGYLIGDGDTGLVDKLHKNKYLIGYTPYALVQHMQSVAVHGSVKDLGRRFYNVGISSSYAIFRKNNFHFSYEIAKYLLKSGIFLIKKWVEMNLWKDDRKKYFSYMQRKGELRFFFYLFDESLKKEILSTDYTN